MESVALSNIAAYTAQVICVVAVAGAVSWLLRMDVPVVRYAYWRALLGFCLLLPLLQGRQEPDASGNVSVAMGVADAVITGTAPAGAAGFGFAATAFVLPVLAAGAALRLLWIGASLRRLRRLRHAGDCAPRSEIQAELETIIGTRCEVRYIERLRQPVTFGLRRPVILLPAALSRSDFDMQRAVLSHELFHVKRRDWAWLVAEEVLCAVLWFNPAVWWAVSRVQLAREAVVDELAVLATGRRRAYVEALIAFADETSLAPVTAFGSQRQLFNRIVLLSKEGVMSSHRLVVTCAVMAAVVITGSWRAVRAFPLAAAPAAQLVDQKGPGPLEQRALAITPENPIPRRVIYEAPAFPPEARDAGARGTVTLMITLDEIGRVAEARSVGLTVTMTTPPVTLIRPGNPESAARFRIEGTVDESVVVQAQGIAAAFTDSALRAVNQWRYDPPAAAPISFQVTINLSHSGNARQANPELVKEVKPVYPPDALQSGAEGSVEVEVTIGTDGKVIDSRVVRSMPVFDEAALTAARQWEFSPVAQPVTLTIEMTFSTKRKGGA